MEQFLPTAKTLRTPNDDELERIYTEAVDWANRQENVDKSVNSEIARATFVREELHRRAIKTATDRVEKLTRFIARLTVVNVIFVAVSVLWVIFWSLLR